MLDRQQIEYIANLARLELTEAEMEKYSSQISGVLEYIEQLQELDVEGVEPTAQVTGLENVLRADEIIEWKENGRNAALNLAPALENGQVKVRRVLK